MCDILRKLHKLQRKKVSRILKRDYLAWRNISTDLHREYILSTSESKRPYSMYYQELQLLSTTSFLSPLPYFRGGKNRIFY